MKKTILTLAILATLSACTKTQTKLEQTNPLAIPPAYNVLPAQQ